MDAIEESDRRHGWLLGERERPDPAHDVHGRRAYPPCASLLAHGNLGRAFLWSLALLAACGASLFLVGRHPPEVAPLTTIHFVGRFDTTMNGWMLDVRNALLTWVCKVLNVIGGGVVTIPVRIAAVL